MAKEQPTEPTPETLSPIDALTAKLVLRGYAEHVARTLAKEEIEGKSKATFDDEPGQV